MNRTRSLAWTLAVPALLAAGTPPPPLAAQSPADLMRSLARGGGWISIPVEGGAGALSTDTLPTLGLRVEGCLSVWPGHSGVWTLDVRDPIAGAELEATALPGEGIPFAHQTRMRSQLDVRVRWSEPRDTTLLVWVGIGATEGDGADRGGGTRDPCTPVYGG